MKTSEFKQHLDQHPDSELSFLLPNGKSIPIHAHITEVGRIEKTFLDCGGKLRTITTCSLQAWVADDVDHRITAGKLASIFEGATEILGANDPHVEIEFEDRLISQYPVVSVENANGVLSFQLESKHTDCLAKDVCLPADEAQECCSGTGCC
ncbi:MAG: DUF6428 family protein [Chthoniobacterales bacterium]